MFKGVVSMCKPLILTVEKKETKFAVEGSKTSQQNNFAGNWEFFFWVYAKSVALDFFTISPI